MSALNNLQGLICHKIQTNIQIIIIVCRIADFVILVDHRVKIKESRKKYKYLDLAKELKKPKKHGGNCDTNCNWCDWNDPLRLDNPRPSKLQYR